MGSPLRPERDRAHAPSRASAAPAAPLPAAELHALPVQEPGAAAGPAERLTVRVDGIFVPTDQPLPVGTIVTLLLKLSEDAPKLTTLARVTEVIPAPAEGGPARMRMEALDVWGERATAQVADFMREASAGPAPSSPVVPGTLVLVVDDDPHYREGAAKVMRESGFEVITAHNGIEALSLALRHQPNLVITDVTMPGMDGWQLLRMIRARPTLRHLPVIFLTQLTRDADRLRGYQLGVDDYVPKPFTDVELVARVERVLERSRAAEESAANGMRGDLSKVPLASLLSLAEMERRSGVLQLTRPSETATLHIRDGAVVRIELPAIHDDKEAMARFFHVLDWTSGRFELTATTVDAADVIELRTSFVLLEHARHYDEQNR